MMALLSYLEVIFFKLMYGFFMGCGLVQLWDGTGTTFFKCMVVSLLFYIASEAGKKDKLDELFDTE